MTHPPKRGMLCNGTRPLVHRGFLASWAAKGFNGRVVERLRGLVSEMPKQQRARVLVTGAPHEPLDQALGWLTCITFHGSRYVACGLHV